MSGLWLLVLGCTRPPPGCEALRPGPEADICWRERLLATGPAGVDAALALAPRFHDPLAREEAAMAWILTYGSQAAPAEAERLCALLPAVEQPSCARRVHAAHLRR